MKLFTYQPGRFFTYQSVHDNLHRKWYNIDRYYTAPSEASVHERSMIAKRLWYNIDKYYTAPGEASVHERSMIAKRL